MLSSTRTSAFLEGFSRHLSRCPLLSLGGFLDIGNHDLIFDHRSEREFAETKNSSGPKLGHDLRDPGKQSRPALEFPLQATCQLCSCRSLLKDLRDLVCLFLGALTLCQCLTSGLGSPLPSLEVGTLVLPILPSTIWGHSGGKPCVPGHTTKI